MEQTKDRDLTILMNALQLSCKYINRAIRKVGAVRGVDRPRVMMMRSLGDPTHSESVVERSERSRPRPASLASTHAAHHKRALPRHRCTQSGNA